MARGADERPQAVASSSKEQLATQDDGATSKKGRGLLVPSRSSSQKAQSSPNLSALSGVTAGNHRNSLDGRSKESRASMLRSNRKGSASSNRIGAGTEPTATPANSEPNTPVAPAPKKKGGLFALFGCCGVPDSANGLDADPVPSHKLDRIPKRPTTSSRPTPTPSVKSASKTQLSEKAETGQSTSLLPGPRSNSKRVSGTSTQDQTVGGRDDESKTLVGHGSNNPTISVDPPQVTPPKSEKDDQTYSEKDPQGDTPMPDVDAQPEDDEAGNGPRVTLPQVPPPPPGPAPTNGQSSALVESTPAFAPDQPQRFLLPPQAPEHKGRKCLVLDLDETLVHSSFKVGVLSFHVMAATRR
jgi:RNA polymerase II subunit A small phosphatase-like protein